MVYFGIKIIYLAGEDLELLGTHGTSRTRAESIQQINFKIPRNAGRAGTGVYFWSYEEDVDLAYELAKLWWQKCFEDHLYAGDQHQDCKVICATLSLDESLYFDTTNSHFQTKLFQIAKSRNITNVSNFSRLYDVMIRNIESELKVKFLVIAANVSRPKNNVQIPMISQTPSFKCYVVRDKFDDVIVVNTIV